MPTLPNSEYTAHAAGYPAWKHWLRAEQTPHYHKPVSYTHLFIQHFRLVVSPLPLLQLFFKTITLVDRIIEFRISVKMCIRDRGEAAERLADGTGSSSKVSSSSKAFPADTCSAGSPSSSCLFSAISEKYPIVISFPSFHKKGTEQANAHPMPLPHSFTAHKPMYCNRQSSNTPHSDIALTIP